jgi:RNA polymerase sigma-70 factor (ECF subfamily)
MSPSLSVSRDSTSASLIARARVGDAQAWERLVELYGPVIYRWGRQAGLQDSDAADVMQEVFRDVARGLGGFQKQSEDDTFRGWLWTIARNQIRRLANRQSHQPRPAGGTAANHRLEQTPDLLEQSSTPDDAAVRTTLVQRALALIQGEFQERTWKAFWRLTMTNDSAATIASELSMTEKSVRQAKYRVLCRLKEILSDE